VLVQCVRRANDGVLVRSLHRQERIPRDRAGTVLGGVLEFAQDFSAAAREGDTSYAFVVALYPADSPTLPERVT